jgi:activating signal cointegrator complex subunit 1
VTISDCKLTRRFEPDLTTYTLKTPEHGTISGSNANFTVSLPDSIHLGFIKPLQLSDIQNLTNEMPRPPPKHRGPSAAKKPPLTHFLCIPLVTATSKPQLEASIASFRSDVCSSQSNETDSADGVTRIHPRAIRPAGVMHCTLGVMSLDGERLGKAVELLKSLDVTQLLSDAASTLPSRASTLADPQATQPEPSLNEKQPASLRRPISPAEDHESKSTSKSSSEPLKIDLQGLVSMHDPQKTSIVYIEPCDPSARLYRFCLALQNIFKQEGIIVPDDRELRLHATLVNTIYAKGKKPQGHGPNANAPLKIDARALLEKYEGFVWARDVVLDRIAICEMGAKKVVENGEVVGEEYTERVAVGGSCIAHIQPTLSSFCCLLLVKINGNWVWRNYKLSFIQTS